MINQKQVCVCIHIYVFHRFCKLEETTRLSAYKGQRSQSYQLPKITSELGAELGLELRAHLNQPVGQIWFLGYSRLE